MYFIVKQKNCKTNDIPISLAWYKLVNITSSLGCASHLEMLLFEGWQKVKVKVVQYLMPAVLF